MRFPLVQMIGQGKRDTMTKRRLVDPVLGAQEDASVAAVAPFIGIEFAERFDQIGLAVEIDRVLLAVDMIDAHGAAAFGPRREVTWLAPFQDFVDPADPFGGSGGIEDEAAQRQ